MDMPVVRASADMRLLRAAVFTAACVTLSAAGHILAAGATIPLWTLGAAVVLVFAVAAPLAGRERSLPGIAGGLAGGQIALHMLFACGQGATVAPSGGSERGGLMALASSLVCNAQALGPMTEAEAHRIVTDAGLGGLVAEQGGHATAALGSGAGLSPGECLQAVVRTALAMASGPMLLGHLAAALGAGWLLRRGEAALWRLIRLSAVATDELLLRALRSALACVRALTAGLGMPDVTVRIADADRHNSRAPQPGALRHTVTRRGPPAVTSDYALTA
ncbi:hypothetical protein [Streptomyces gobiensis]|uniref:hypothetical protein n=1 Tax=Streptomyces gobiensis TaxID=2875706 RepID=UPI001E2FEDEE|nr:hypothetical protein [Streptomyces gobiensis]UGY92485.1 hypothetical protein test1122_12665 [Streptomyces gobiensis]